MEILDYIWSARVQIVPVALSVFLFELPAIVRRFKKVFYVPLYFSVFPLREINEDLSAYLVEDEMYGRGERLSEKEAETLRKKIILVSIVSLAVSALLTPLIVGFISAFILADEIFVQFLVILLTYKTILITKSIISFHYHTVGSGRNIVLLVFTYICYLGVIFEVLRNTYYWTAPYVASGNWANLASDLSGLIFGKFIVGILLLALLTAVFVSLITDRSIRDRALAGDE